MEEVLGEQPDDPGMIALAEAFDWLYAKGRVAREAPHLAKHSDGSFARTRLAEHVFSAFDAVDEARSLVGPSPQP